MSEEASVQETHEAEEPETEEVEESEPEVVDIGINVNEEPEKPTKEIFGDTRPPEVVEPPEGATLLPLDGLRNNDDSSEEEEPNELDKAIELLVNRFEIPPPELRQPILQLVEKRRVEALMKGDYDKAETQDKIVSVYQMVVQQDQQKQSEDRSIDALYQRWAGLQKKQQLITANWDQKIESFLAETETQLEELQVRQDQEVDEFILKWKDPAFLRPFSKPSPRLLQLREQERAMAVSRMYAQAKEMKAIADRVQREETQAAQAKINAQMAVERHKLTLKHEKELKTLTTHRDRTVKSMQNNKAKELRPVVTAIQQIKAKKATPAKLPSSLPMLPTARAETASASGSHLDAMIHSPRTQARFSQFRAEKKTTLLEVVPVDEQTLQQMKRPPRTSRATSCLTARKQTTVTRTTANRKPPTGSRIAGRR